MSEDQNNFQSSIKTFINNFNFPQLLILLALQLLLLGGSFYLGTKWSGPSKRISKGPIQDQEVAHLLPQAKPLSEEKEEKKESPGGQKSFTPFDKSASAVFRIKSSSNSEYTLQIASYPDELAAVQVIEEWKNKGYIAFLSVEEIPDKGKWYRVNIGNFGDQKSAQEFSKQFQEKENIVPQVVVNQ